MKEVVTIFNLAYDSYKREMAIRRKIEKSNISPIDAKIKECESDLRRYSRLLKDKKIKQIEFEFLKKIKESEIKALKDESAPRKLIEF